jgi:hypothetical protein
MGLAVITSQLIDQIAQMLCNGIEVWTLLQTIAAVFSSAYALWQDNEVFVFGN